jgi:hypothetical protein
LRIAFARASLPAAPPIRVAGQPSTDASGGTSTLASIATPTNRPAAPRPIASSRVPVARPETNRPIAISAIAARIVKSAAGVPKRANRDGGSSAPSRTAAIGCTCVARNAGRSAASAVISTPTASETTIVRVAKTVLACGRSMPKETNSEFRPLASPRPRNNPIADASNPITSASSSTERST